MLDRSFSESSGMSFNGSSDGERKNVRGKQKSRRMVLSLNMQEFGWKQIKITKNQVFCHIVFENGCHISRN